MRKNLTLATTTLVATLLVSLAPVACGTPCREIATRSLDFECAAVASFTGELHFDSRATFDTFLRQQCLPNAERAQADDIMDGVDFTTEAVFVAAGPHRLDDQRCLVSQR